MIRNMATLLTGNALAQVVNVVTILFVVTSFFAPAEFGRYAVVMSFVGILSSVACFRYELAIVAVGRDNQANNFVFASVAIATMYSLLVFAVLTILAVTIGSDLLGGASPVMIAGLTFLKAIDQVCASIFYRHEAYTHYSLLKLLQALVLMGGFVAAGVTGEGVQGLLLSTLLAYASFAGVGFVVAQRYKLRPGVRLIRMAALLRKHHDFAKFNTPQALVDNLLSNGLNFVLVVLTGPAVVGYFSYMQKTVKAPLGLIFGAISQVVFRFSAKNKSNSELVTWKLRQVFAATVLVLMTAAAGVALAFTFFVELDFLSGWAGLREYMIAFALWFLVPFIFSPFATLPIVFDRQKRFFQLATTFNLFSFAALTLLVWHSAVVTAFWAVGLLSIVYYVGINAWLYGVARSGQKG